MCLTLLNVINYNLLRCRLWYCHIKFLNINFIPRQFYDITNHELYMRKNNIRTMAMVATQHFKGREDRFNGVIVDSSVEQCKIEDFATKLDESLKAWIDTHKRGIWFKVALEHAEWIPILAKKGFDFHHARDGFVMMYRWLPKEEDNNIPQYSHTMIGVGAVVVNDNNEILVVREKYFIVKPHWKLPGGYVEAGENLIDAAIREVFEETGIHTEFRSVLNLRHAHHGMFDCSDMYIVVSLKPLSTTIEKSEREITACEWMDINAYLNLPEIHELNKFFVHTYLEYQKNEIKIDCQHGIHQVLKKPFTVYHVTTNVKDST